MTDTRKPAMHLTDEEIDAYWKEQLSSGDEQRVEQHLLECSDCQLRVEAIEALVDELGASDGFRPSRSLTYWRIAALLFAAFSLFAGWQLARDRPGTIAGITSVPLDAGLVSVQLAPPTRDAGIVEVGPLTAGIVVFVLDAREGGAAGTRFDVHLNASSGDRLLQLSGVESASDGTIRVPVDGSLLAAGSYTFELRAGPIVVDYPFLIKR